MADITSIEVLVKTSNLEHADTDSFIYLGLGGREFVLDDPDRDDFERGATNFFRLEDPSRAPNVDRPELNSPTLPPLDTEVDLAVNPVYIRKGADHLTDTEKDKGWNVESVSVSVISTADVITYRREFPANSGLWLLIEAGLICYIQRVGLPSVVPADEIFNPDKPDKPVVVYKQKLPPEVE